MMKIKITSKDILGFILLSILTALEIGISIQQQCGPGVLFSPETSGYALTGSEYKSFTTASYAACLMACEADMSCMSLNFLMTTSTCDLNLHTKESKPTAFIERHNSIYSINPAGRIRPKKKGTQANPGKSCLEILRSGASTGTGVYWVDPANTGNPIQAYCDMTTDGGGWTVVKRLVQPSTTPLPNLAINTYEVIKEYNRTDVNILPKGSAMLDIQQKMGFHQIHFYCRKVSVGRVVSIMTKNNTAGQAVVSYFTSIMAVTPPAACGSFDRLPEDTSVLGQNCNKWGGELEGEPAEVETNQWGGVCCTGQGRLTVRTFQIASSPSYGFEIQVYYVCDNNIFTDFTLKVPPDANDMWQISVR